MTVDVPADSPLARKHLVAKEEVLLQQQQLKQMTLKLDAMERSRHSASGR
mgnify:CR=1 FL=1